MQIGDLFKTIAPTNVRVHRVALNRTRANKCNFNHKVVELPRLKPRKRSHLRATLDLENTDGIGNAQHVVHSVVLRHLGDVNAQAIRCSYRIDGVVQRGEHAETEEVELHQTRCGAIVLIPLQNASVFATSPFDRTHLDNGTIAKHHAAGMNAEMARCMFDLCGQLDDSLRNSVGIGFRRNRVGVVFKLGDERTPTIDIFGPCIGLTRGIPKRTGHIAHCRTRPIGDDIGHLCGVVTAMTLVDVLNDFFASTRFDVDIDIGRTIALGRKKPFEQQTQLDGVGFGDTQRETHRGVGSRPATLAVDVVATTKIDKVVNDQEVTGEPELFDDGQFVIDLRPCAANPFTMARPIATFGAAFGQPP